MPTIDMTRALAGGRSAMVYSMPALPIIGMTLVHITRRLHMPPRHGGIVFRLPLAPSSLPFIIKTPARRLITVSGGMMMFTGFKWPTTIPSALILCMHGRASRVAHPTILHLHPYLRVFSMGALQDPAVAHTTRLLVSKATSETSPDETMSTIGRYNPL